MIFCWKLVLLAFKWGIVFPSCVHNLGGKIKKNCNYGQMVPFPAVKRWVKTLAKRAHCDRGGSFSFSLGGRRGDRSIFSRSSSALANSLSSLAPVSFSFCQTTRVGFPWSSHVVGARASLKVTLARFRENTWSDEILKTGNSINDRYNHSRPQRRWSVSQSSNGSRPLRTRVT